MCQINVIAKLRWSTSGTFGCERDQRMKAVEQHDDAVVANLEQSIRKVAFGIRVALWIVDHVRRYGASNVMVDRTESPQVNDGELRVLVVLESGRAALKYQWVLPPNGRFLRHRPKRSERCKNYGQLCQGQPALRKLEGVPEEPSLKTMLSARFAMNAVQMQGGWVFQAVVVILSICLQIGRTLD